MKHTHLVDMKTEEGYILRNLEAIVEDRNIHFVRDKNNVHAWHCNNIREDNYNVVKIIKI